MSDDPSENLSAILITGPTASGKSALALDLARAHGGAVVNARLGYEPDGGAWRIEAFVENAFDRNYVKDAGNTGDGLGLPTFIGGEPRFYGVSLTVRSR